MRMFAMESSRQPCVKSSKGPDSFPCAKGKARNGSLNPVCGPSGSFTIGARTWSSGRNMEKQHCPTFLQLVRSHKLGHCKKGCLPVRLKLGLSEHLHPPTGNLSGIPRPFPGGKEVIAQSPNQTRALMEPTNHVANVSTEVGPGTSRHVSG